MFVTCSYETDFHRCMAFTDLLKQGKLAPDATNLNLYWWRSSLLDGCKATPWMLNQFLQRNLNLLECVHLHQLSMVYLHSCRYHCSSIVCARNKIWFRECLTDGLGHQNSACFCRRLLVFRLDCHVFVKFSSKTNK